MIVKVKGYEFDAVIARDSFDRRAVQLKNNIIHALKKLGIPDGQVEIPLEPGFKKVAASVEWFAEGHRMFYQYDVGKFVNNLYVVSKVLELEVAAVLNEEKSMMDFIGAFAEDEDVEEKRKQAREVLGLNHDVKNLDEINKRYKDLARAHHPDTPTGNLEKFKAINHAHKTLKRELE